MKTTRHGRLETVTNPDGSFFLRLIAANGRTLMHSEQLTGRQILRARTAIETAFRQYDAAEDECCECPACMREYGEHRDA